MLSLSHDNLMDLRSSDYHEVLVQALQDEFLADDLTPPAEALVWTEFQLRSWFASGGDEIPAPQGPGSGGSSPRERSPCRASAMRVLCFGDSLISGWLPVGCEGNARPLATPPGTRLEAVLQARVHPQTRVRSEGCPGWTAQQMAARLDSPSGLRKILSRAIGKNDPYNVVIILAGVNDFLRDPLLMSGDATAADIVAVADRMIGDLAQLHAAAHEQGVATVALGLMATTWIPAERAADINRRIRTEVGATMYVDSAELLPLCEEYYCSDGVHPTRSGYAAFGDALGAALSTELPYLSTGGKTLPGSTPSAWPASQSGPPLAAWAERPSWSEVLAG